SSPHTRTRRSATEHIQRQRIAILLSLEKLSKQLQSDVLADKGFSRQFDLKVVNTVDLADTSLRRDKLFNAFEQASKRNTSVKRKLGTDGPVATVGLDEQGTGYVRVGTTQFLFANAALLSASYTKRKRFAKEIVLRHTLHSSAAAEFFRLVDNSKSSH